MRTSDEIDRATSDLYQQVRASAQHGEFIRTIEDSAAPTPAGPRPQVLVMPGAFHVEHKHTGADGKRVFQLAAQLGWPAERVDVPSFAPMQKNATALIEHLRRVQGGPIILVSLSKGGADVRAALAQDPAAFSSVRAWVNISGIVTGTPLVAWLKARPLRCLGVRLLLRLCGQRFAQVEEMRHGPGSPLDAPLILPDGMQAIHVVGFPRVRDLSNDWARRGHARLAALGPNDGGGILLRDVVLLPGVTYPVWSADHYLTPSWDIQPLLLRILRQAAQLRSPVAAEASA
jgi:hypothetical protein